VRGRGGHRFKCTRCVSQLFGMKLRLKWGTQPAGYAVFTWPLMRLI
jgi:hypothetical protein